jgi:hypothetical protein
MRHIIPVTHAAFVRMRRAHAVAAVIKKAASHKGGRAPELRCRSLSHERYRLLGAVFRFGHKCPARRRAHEADRAFDKLIEEPARASFASYSKYSEHDETGLGGLRHRFGSTVCIELGKNSGDVKLRRVKRNTQPAGDRFV